MEKLQQKPPHALRNEGRHDARRVDLDAIGRLDVLKTEIGIVDSAHAALARKMKMKCVKFYLS